METTPWKWNFSKEFSNKSDSDNSLGMVLLDNSKSTCPTLPRATRFLIFLTSVAVRLLAVKATMDLGWERI